MSQAQAQAQTVVSVVAHTSNVYYKTFTEGSDGFAKLKALVDEGKLAMEQIDVGSTGEGDDAKVTWKRKQATLSVPVPVLASALKEGAFTLPQVSHLQSVLNKYFEDKQRPYLDAVSDTVVDWAAVLEGPYNLKKAAIKVTAEMVAAATVVLAQVLPTISSAKVSNVVVEMAKKKFASSVTRAVEVNILEKINGLVLEAFDLLSADEQATHEPVFELWAGALAEAISPAEVEEALSLDDFNMEG